MPRSAVAAHLGGPGDPGDTTLPSAGRYGEVRHRLPCFADERAAVRGSREVADRGGALFAHASAGRDAGLLPTMMERHESQDEDHEVAVDADGCSMVKPLWTGPSPRPGHRVPASLIPKP